MRIRNLFVCLAFSLLLSCQTKKYEKTDNGILIHISPLIENGVQTIRLNVINTDIIRVTATPSKDLPEIKSLMSLDKKRPSVKWEVKEDSNQVILSTSRIKVQVNLTTGEVLFLDSLGNSILREVKGGGKTFSKDTFEKKGTYYGIRQVFDSPSNEALYGLGQHQLGYMNYKGKDLTLAQYNTTAVIPFVISTNHYGILWDNNSLTKFGDPSEYKPLSGLKLYNANGESGGLTAKYTDRKNSSRVFLERQETFIDFEFLSSQKNFPKGFDIANGKITWEGFIETDAPGANRFYVYCAGYTKIWMDGQLVIDKWRQNWNAVTSKFNLAMEKGKKYPVKIEWMPDASESYLAVKWLSPTAPRDINSLSLSSEVAKAIDYYFIYGENMDNIISGYREITGKAQVMPKWAMGLWQSRERYKTQGEILDVVKQFRDKKIPLDNIVLDWQYWKADQWGSQEFDVDRFPNPKGMMDTLHKKFNTHLMISVWAKFYTNTENYKLMNAKGYMYNRNVEKKQKDWLGYVSTFYDPYNPDARTMFWDLVNKGIYSRGVDGWWLDASEPDINSNMSIEERKELMGPTYLGSASEYLNSFSLVNAQAIYEGQRAVNPNERVYILTRSAFAGLQRYGAATWSGDVGSRWEDMKNQISAGVNFSMSGLPYWTMDIGGFSVEKRYEKQLPSDMAEWRELQTRWMQFGAFCPIFRVHGQFPYREMYNVAPENSTEFQSILYYDRLRYTLMPYVYSLTGAVWIEDYTLMRGLVMDFPSDQMVQNINDQYMFGSAFMVAPVYKFKERARKVYLPASCGWYDFNSGKHFTGGQTIDAEAPLAQMPLFVREGAIVPTGPSIQYATERAADTITLQVYTGKDAFFTLYEDENTNYNYEKGAYATIPITYSENKGVLTIGNRKGEFKGMLSERLFKVIWVTPSGKLSSEKLFKYGGNELKINRE